MEIKETNAELRATNYMLDRERETLELKLAALQSQLQAYLYVKVDEQQVGPNSSSILINSVSV